MADTLGIPLEYFKEEFPAGTYCWCIHHEDILEQLTLPISERIKCILAKPRSQRLARLKALRVVKDQKAVSKLWFEYRRWRKTARSRIPSRHLSTFTEWIRQSKRRLTRVMNLWNREYPDHPTFDFRPTATSGKWEHPYVKGLNMRS